MKKLLKILTITVEGIFIFFFLCGISLAETPGDVQWEKLITRHTVIQYQSIEDLKNFNKKISYLPNRWGLDFLSSQSEIKGLKNRITKKVDALHKRVQDILGMRKLMSRETILLYPNKEKLHAAFSRISKKHRLAYGKSSFPRAWYIHARNSIYINVEDLHEGILAHEMAHAIVDSYLLIQPPESTSEILARYVESHLFIE